MVISVQEKVINKFKSKPIAELKLLSGRDNMLHFPEKLLGHLL